MFIIEPPLFDDLIIKEIFCKQNNTNGKKMSESKYKISSRLGDCLSKNFKLSDFICNFTEAFVNAVSLYITSYK